jgi:hypothetical protein
MEQNELFERLNALLPAQFEEIVFRLSIPPQYLSTAAPLATRSIEVLRYLTQKNQLRALEALLLPATRTTSRSKDASPGQRLKILFMGAAPLDQVQLALGKEVTKIDSNLRESDGGRQFELAQEWAMSPAALTKALLRHQPQIVHFSGHGARTGELIFESEDGASQSASVDALGRLFAVINTATRSRSDDPEAGIRCVVLNACYAETQAQAIRQHVDCVVGTLTAVADVAAIAFVSSFYLALGYGQTVKTAFDLGCLQIDLLDLPGSDTPVLLCKDGIDPAKVRFGNTSGGGDGTG